VIDAIRTVLTHYCAENARYKHLGFSSKEMAIVSQLGDALKQLLPEYTFWDGDQPFLNNPPAAGCSRKFLMDATFKTDHRGLIISRPGYWLHTFSDADKAVFWTALGAKDGGHQVIVIFPESHEFKRLNRHFLHPEPLDGLSVTLWTSGKKQHHKPRFS